MYVCEFFFFFEKRICFFLKREGSGMFMEIIVNFIK